MNSFLATVRPSAWRGVCAVMKGSLKYTLLMNIFCLENPHASHNAVNGSRGWSGTLKCRGCSLGYSPALCQWAPFKFTLRHVLGLAAPTCWETCSENFPGYIQNAKLPAGHRRSSSQGLHHSQPIFCLHCTIFCGGSVWKKKKYNNQKPAYICVHTIKKAKLGVCKHI